MSLLETLTFAGSHADEARAWLTRVPAADYIFGALSTEVDEVPEDEPDRDVQEGDKPVAQDAPAPVTWVRPERLTSRQRQALSSCLAWHPGLYRQMAGCTAGVCLKFVTDASQVALAVRFDDQPNGTAVILDDLDRSAGAPREAHDGVSCVVDGVHVGCLMPAPIGRTLPWLQNDPRTSLVCFEIDTDDVDAVGVATMALPGLGAVHEVELWLPALRGCEVSELWLDGTFVERAQPKERLLVIGDSIGQGFISEAPDLCWASLIARKLDLELINQSVGGQVAQPTMLSETAIDLVQTIVVELGGNYRWEPCALWEVERDVKAIISSLTRTYPGTRIVAITPFDHDEAASPSHPRSCWSNISWERLLKGVPAVRMRGAYIEPNVTVVDGAKLASRELGHFADSEHPSIEGHGEIAERLMLVLGEAEPEARREVALETLGRLGVRGVPAREAVLRGLAEVVYADEGCVLIKGHTGFQMILGQDHARATRAAEYYFDPSYTFVLEPGLEEDLSVALDLNHRAYAYLCVFEGTSPVPFELEEGITLRTLDASFAPEIMKNYEFPQLLDGRRLRLALEQGRFLGAFSGDDLVGFVGEHPEGSVGLLTVYPDFREQGIGFALEAQKINDQLEAGYTPWCEVMSQNRISYSLHERLGFTILDSKNICYLDRE